MKHAVVCFSGFEQAELQEVAAPPEVGPGEVSGPTVCTLISPGTELAHGYQGQGFPYYPGYAAVFRAEQVGSEVAGIKPGDLLFGMGPHRSFQLMEAAQALPVPTGLEPQVAVLARLMGVSTTTLITTTARPGDQVVISGAGPVGFLAAQIFKDSGYEVLVVEPDAARRALVEANGLPAVERALGTEVEGHVALVVECSGHESAVLDACRTVRQRGEVVLVGVPWQRRTEHTAHDLLTLIFHRYVVLRSGWEWELPLTSVPFRPHSNLSCFQLALRRLAAGRIRLEGTLNPVSPADPQHAYANLLHRQAPGLFTIFDWETWRGLSGSD